MKKFTLSILAVMITAFVMTSCIDNAVSPEVKAIRAAQANLVTAQAALKNAEAAAKNAEAALTNADAAWTNADADFRAAQAAQLLVQLEIDQANAEVAVAQAAITLQQAIDDLAFYIAARGLQDADSLLQKYGAAIDNVRATASDIADVNYNIAVMELFLVDSSKIDLNTIRAERQRVLDEAEVDLASAEAALAIVVAVEADPTAAAATRADLKAQIQDIKNQLFADSIDLVPVKADRTAANDDLTDAIDAWNPLDSLVNAINDIKDAYADQEAVIADAEADEADALADAIAASANLQAELDPFLDALLLAYADNAQYVGIVTGLEHDLRVALNEWKVALAQGKAIVAADPTADISDAPTYDAAVSNLQDAITAIEDLTEIDTNIDVEDETTYPEFDAEVFSGWNLTVAATTSAVQVGVSYSDGVNNFRVSEAALNGATTLKVTAAANSNTAPVAANLTFVGTAGTNPPTIDFTGGVLVATTGPYALNDEDGVITNAEVDDLYDGLIKVDADGPDNIAGNGDYDAAGTLGSPDPASAYAQASVLYTPVEAFFSGGIAADLVTAIGRYNGANFLSNLTDPNDAQFADGVLADLPEDGVAPGKDDNGWQAYWTAGAAVTTQEGYLAGIEDGDDGSISDGPDVDLDAQYDIVADYDDDDDYATGGYDDAIDMEADALAALADAQADVDAAQATFDTADAAYDAVNDPMKDLVTEQGDLEDVLDAVDNFIDGINFDIKDFRDAVESAQEAVDIANFGLIDVDFTEAKALEILAKEQEYLADLEAKLASYQAEAAAWLALLNAALAG